MIGPKQRDAASTHAIRPCAVDNPVMRRPVLRKLKFLASQTSGQRRADLAYEDRNAAERSRNLEPQRSDGH